MGEKVAIVTGASRGIGLATARELVADGWRVCLTARGAAALDTAVAELGGPPVALGVAGKAHDDGHQAEAVARTVDTFGRLDLLVNCTGVNPVYGPLLDLEPAALRKIFEVNVFAALGWVRHAVAGGLAEHEGAVVNVASVAGLAASEGIGAYGASKAALLHLTRQLAVELAPRIRVNAVAPAVVRTRFAAYLYEGKEVELAGRYPLGRLGAPEDVAAAVAYLASPRARWVTGHTMVLDGGVSLVTEA